MKPTQDKELRTVIGVIISADEHGCNENDCDTCKYFKTEGGNHCKEPPVTEQILLEFENRGYHK